MVGHARGRRERRAAPPVGLNTLVRRRLAGGDLEIRVLGRCICPTPEAGFHPSMPLRTELCVSAGNRTSERCRSEHFRDETLDPATSARSYGHGVRPGADGMDLHGQSARTPPSSESRCVIRCSHRRVQPFVPSSSRGRAASLAFAVAGQRRRRVDPRPVRRRPLEILG